LGCDAGLAGGGGLPSYHHLRVGCDAGLAGGGGLFLSKRRCGIEAAVMEGFERRGR
jgi:hypothetical protein